MTEATTTLTRAVSDKGGNSALRWSEQLDVSWITAHTMLHTAQ